MAVRRQPRFEIRRARPQDLEEILAIERASFRHPWSTEMFRRELEHDWSTIMVAVEPVAPEERKGGEPWRAVGFLIYWNVHDEVHVLNLAVRPESRRRGVGRALMAEAAAAGVASGFGLDLETLPTHLTWPSPRNMAHAVSTVRRLRADVVHAYEWGPAIDVALGPHLLLGTPAVVTTLSMYVSGYIPRHVPLIVGTRRLAQEAAARHRDVRLMEPPIDTAATTIISRYFGGSLPRRTAVSS